MIGLNFPFSAATGSLGYLEPTSSVASAIEANARALLITNRGERVMHVDMGCNLREFLFEQKTGNLKPRVAARITSQFAKWMPFVTITKLYVFFQEDDSSIPDNGMRIHLELVYGNISISVVQAFGG